MIIAPWSLIFQNQYCFLKDTCFKCNCIRAASSLKLVQAPKLDDNLGDCCDIDNKIFNNFHLSKKVPMQPLYTPGYTPKCLSKQFPTLPRPGLWGGKGKVEECLLKHLASDEKKI